MDSIRDVLEVGIDFVVKEWTEDGEWVPSLSAAKKYVIKKQADWEKQHGEEAEPEKVDERTGPARHTSELQPGIKEIAHGIVTLDGMVDGAGRLTTEWRDKVAGVRNSEDQRKRSWRTSTNPFTSAGACLPTCLTRNTC